MASKNITRKISIFINGKEVKNNLNSVGKEIGKLKGQLRNLVPGTQDFINKSKELKKAQKAYADINNEIRGTQGLLGKIKKQVGPVGSAFAAAFSAAAIISFANHLLDTVNIFRDLQHETKQLTGLQGELLDGTVTKVKAISDTFRGDYKEILLASNTLVKQMGVSYDEALNMIEKGYLAGADVSGDMLNQIKEYAPFMKEANIELDEMVALIAQTEKEGIFNDKGIDAIKEGMLKIREGTNATREAMNALGLDTKQIYKDLEEGNITYFEAMQLVSGELSNVEEQSPKVGQAIADIFGGPGEDAGLQYLKNIKDIDLNLDNLIDTTDEFTQILKNETEANEALNNSWIKLTTTGGKLNLLMTSLKGILAQTLDGLATIGMSDAEIAAKMAIRLTEKNNREQREAEQKQFNEYIDRRKKSLGKLYDFEAAKESYLNSIRTSIQNRIDEGNEKAMKKYLKIFQVASSFTNPDGTTTTTTPNEPTTPEGNGEGEEKLTPEDRKILNSKKKLAEIIAAFDEEQRIQEEVKKFEKDQQEEEAEVLRLENKYLKMAEDAGYETVVAAGLEDVKNEEIQKVRDKWDLIHKTKKKKHDDEIEKLDKKTKDAQIAAEIRLENAKKTALFSGISSLKSVFNEKTAIYKVLFGLEKALAINEIIVSAGKANANITASTAIANSKAIAASPLTAGMPWVGINTASAAKNITATNLVAAAEVASIAASALKGFKTGGYTGVGESTDVAGIQHKDEYVVPQFIMQDPTYAPIINQLETKRTDTLGVENSLPASVSDSTGNNNEMVATAFYALIDKLNEPLFAQALIGDAEIQRQKLRNDKLEKPRQNAKIK